MQKIYHADFSYLGLRELIGFVGLVMPLAVWIIGRITVLPFDTYDTVSAHYYSKARDVFVGSMALIGTLIYFYRSPHKIDSWVARITGIAAVLIGMLPMEHKPGMHANNAYSMFENLHAYPVTVFFVGGIYLVLISFRKTTYGQAAGVVNTNVTTAQLENANPKKKLRNRIFVWCAVIMILGCAVLAAGNYLEPTMNWWRGWRFWPETAAIAAFAFAWLVKGQALEVIHDPNASTAVKQIK